MFRLTPEPGVGLFPPDEQEATVAVSAEQLMPAEHIGSLSPIKILFGPFELNVAERSLRKADDVIPLGGRAFDILLALQPPDTKRSEPRSIGAMTIFQSSSGSSCDESQSS